MPYFGPTLEYPKEARSLWEGYRGIEEYAREVFPLEEAANGMTWMDDAIVNNAGGAASNDDGENDDDDAVSDVASSVGFLTSTSSATPIRTPFGTPGARTPKNHPEGESHDFFVGSC